MPKNLFRPIHGHARRGFKSPTYSTWENMNSRCNRPTAGGYKFYGGRGIRVCGRWLSFENFLADMGERPIGKTLERNDSNGNYEPSNCRWATIAEQNANKRNSLLVAYQGRTQSLQTWCTELGLNWGTTYWRLNSGMTPEEAFTTPVRCQRWSPWEDTIIRAFYPQEGGAMWHRLSSRSPDAIVVRAGKIGVRFARAA